MQTTSRVCLICALMLCSCTCQKLNNAAGDGRWRATFSKAFRDFEAAKVPMAELLATANYTVFVVPASAVPLIEAGTNSLPFLRKIEQQNDPRADLARACRTIIEGEVLGVSKPQPSAAGGRCLVSYSVSNRPLRYSAWASEPGSPQIRISSGIPKWPAAFSYTIAAANDNTVGYRLESEGRLIATEPLTNVVSLLDLGSSLFRELCSITASHHASSETSNPEVTLSVEFTHEICNQTFSASGTHEDLYHLISNAPALGALLESLSAGNGKMYQLWGESDQVVPAEIRKLVRPDPEN